VSVSALHYNSIVHNIAVESQDISRGQITNCNWFAGTAIWSSEQKKIEMSFNQVFAHVNLNTKLIFTADCRAGITFCSLSASLTCGAVIARIWILVVFNFMHIVVIMRVYFRNNTFHVHWRAYDGQKGLNLHTYPKCFRSKLFSKSNIWQKLHMW
jgi:hypothetical protein